MWNEGLVTLVVFVIPNRGTGSTSEFGCRLLSYRMDVCTECYEHTQP